MSDSAAPTGVSATASAATKKKVKSAASKKPKMTASHPKVSEMVISAITSLKERGGSSLQAIKKHIVSSHKVDIDHVSPLIKKYLKSAVATGALVQTKGKGATGSFKLSGQKEAAALSKPKAKKPAAKKDASPSKKTAKSAGKKKRTGKKPVFKKKPVKKTDATNATMAKIAKNSVKATKPKTPKPKKVKTPKKPVAKKTGKK